MKICIHMKAIKYIVFIGIQVGSAVPFKIFDKTGEWCFEQSLTEFNHIHDHPYCISHCYLTFCIRECHSMRQYPIRHVLDVYDLKIMPLLCQTLLRKHCFKQ